MKLLFILLFAVHTVSASWVKSAMVTLVPRAPWAASYDEVAKAIADESNEHPVFSGDDGSRKTAALLVAIAYYESRFRPDAVGDHGRSLGLFQIQPATVSSESPFSLTTPREAARVALKLVRTSFHVCRSEALEEQLGWYAAGGNECKEAGRKKSVWRFHLAARILRAQP